MTSRYVKEPTWPAALRLDYPAVDLSDEGAGEAMYHLPAALDAVIDPGSGADTGWHNDSTASFEFSIMGVRLLLWVEPDDPRHSEWGAPGETFSQNGPPVTAWRHDSLRAAPHYVLTLPNPDGYFTGLMVQTDDGAGLVEFLRWCKRTPPPEDN